MNRSVGAVIADTGTVRPHGVIADDKAERAISIIRAFRECGIGEIVLVTAPGEKALRRRVSSLHVTFLTAESDDWEMFDYIKAGCVYLAGKCGRIFITPLHIPFFRPATCLLEMEHSDRIIIPLYREMSGHPLLIDAALIPEILAYRGENGMRGAVSSLGVPILFLPVEDPGIRMDSKSLDEYLELRNVHGRDMLRMNTELTVSKEEVFFDAGMSSFLRQVDRLGSVREAAEKSGISYSKAWKMIAACEEAAGREVVTRLHGGKYGGEAYVTEFGRSMVRAYEEMSRSVRAYAEKEFEKYRDVWAADSNDCV